MTTSRQHRGAITLVELLVVISILGTLAAIVATFAPRMMEQSRVAEGTRQLQGWLQIARQRAIRDQAPCGIRLINPGMTPTAVNQNLYNQFAYVHQPEDITIDPVEVPGGIPGRNMCLAVSNALDGLATQASLPPVPNQYLAQFYASYRDQIDPAKSSSGPMLLLLLPGRVMRGTFQRGDVVELGATRYYMVTDAIDFPALPATPTDSLLVLHRQRDLRNDLPMARVTRSARPVAGEPEMNLPANIAIDVIKRTTGVPGFEYFRSWPAPSTTEPSENVEFDIMFSRTGEIVGPLSAHGRIVLWVRDVSLGEPLLSRGDLPPGDNRLILVNTRTGQVTGHPVFEERNPTNPQELRDPFQFLRDGKSSAME